MSTENTRRRGRRPTLSLDTVVSNAVALLDESGVAALTLRALASRLDTGVGSLYHYVASKEDLINLATNEVMGEAIATLDLPDDPIDALRELSMAFFTAMQRHFWLGPYLMRDTTMQPNSMKLFELFGQQLLPLDLTPRQRFNAVTSLINFVTGFGAEMSEQHSAAPVANNDASKQEDLGTVADRWRAFDEEEFPFLHSIVDEFEHHDDALQFQEGVDLFLSGIATLAGIPFAPGRP
ncbi:TetR/AcrR family transcriptional regulator [Corynebacterium vitaeruminis]|uniref:TetR family transcriptional regulator n=1 Tax=Corynebacterium vitaeruminis DSM 20294 TaxID=1224164 RepID=W5XX99_9CORY|nr:TetR/AcrR family transcriptional regulator [Corynebacterium vitaeruminis]AHI21646.1 TetR family transcriptional regulator [Corynebacterium vitaeruminis DSM 20294]